MWTRSAAVGSGSVGKSVGGVCLVLCALVGWATAASAHGGDGVIEVGDPVASGDLEVEFPIRITYEADGHAAEEIEGLSVSGQGPDGATFGPGGAFVAGDAPGVQTVTITLPSAGQWELTVSASEPPSTASLTVDVVDPSVQDAPDEPVPDPDEAPDAPDAEDPTDSDGDDTVGSGSGDDGAPADLASDSDSDSAGAGEDSDDGGGVPIFAVGIGLAAAVVAGVVGYRWSVGRSPAGQEPTRPRRRPTRPGGPS